MNIHGFVLGIGLLVVEFGIVSLNSHGSAQGSEKNLQSEVKRANKYSIYDEEAFTFHLFENFELARDVFVSEIELVKKLKDHRTRLAAQFNPKGVLLKYNPNDFNGTFGDVEDYLGAVKGMVFLHDTYSFDLNKLSKGLIASKTYPHGPLLLRSQHSLGFFDFLKFAKQAFAFKFYDRAIEFLKVALKLQEQVRLSEKELKELQKLKKHLVLLNNQNLYQSGQTIHGDFKILPYIITDNLKRKKNQPDFVKDGNILSSSPVNRFERDARFRKVCNGNLDRNGNSQIPHQCHWLHHDDPFLKLGPFKMEMASRSPFIVVFHDFLAETEIQFLVDYSRPRLSRGRFQDLYNQALASGHNQGKKVTRIVHKSVQAWIADLEYHSYHDNLEDFELDFNYTILMPNLFKLTQRLGLATALNTTSKYATTEYQTTNYGLGGLCETHYDPHGYIEGVELPPHPKFKRYLKWGDMMATTMAWLEEVEAGGATGFASPGHEVLVWPRKGSVAFWFDLDRKGHRDTRLLHGGCPIIKGSKWILNKWIHYYDQFPKYRCSLDPTDFIEAFTGVY